MTGVDAPYQTPENPEIRLETVEPTVEETGLEVIRDLVEQGVLNQSVFEEKTERNSEEELDKVELEEKFEEVDLAENSEKSNQKRKFKKKNGKKKKDRR